MKRLGSARNQLILFFILVFAIGWMGMLPALTGSGLLRYSAFLYLFSPAIAALVTSGITDGLPGIKGVLGRYLLWRAHLGWYLLALLLVPGISYSRAIAIPVLSIHAFHRRPNGRQAAGGMAGEARDALRRGRLGV